MESWIIEYELNKKLIIVTRRKDCLPNDEELKSFSYPDSLKINSFDGIKFVTSLVDIKDTVSFKLKQW